MQKSKLGFFSSIREKTRRGKGRIVPSHLELIGKAMREALEMGWMEFIGAIGIGAIVIKLLDVLWLQKVINESERQRWLRAEKLRVYGSLSKELTRLAGWGNWWEVKQLAIEAMLLEEDGKVRNRIDDYLNDIKEAYRAVNEKLKESERYDPGFGFNPETDLQKSKDLLEQKERMEAEAKERLLADARAIVDMLRLSLIKR
jgi:hypothetical protein